MPKTYPDIPRPGDPTFTNFPKTLPDDCIQYTLHILNSPTLPVSAQRSRLLDIRRAAEKLCKELLTGYIWQREAFRWDMVDSGDGNWCLAGSTCFGDSISDEWLIVYILRNLSKKFEDAWIRVVDADGEFLLIEAANTLPRWLNPEVAEWRVWINRGQLRIIPRETVAASKNDRTAKTTQRAIPRNLTCENALNYMRNSSDTMIHSPLIEEEAFYRLRNYPAAIAESMHTASLTIPRNLAYILHRTPTHISAAVEAFYLRDPISLRPLQNKQGQSLKFPPKDLVTTSIMFTRVGYAQMKSQEFNAPAAWAPVLQEQINRKDRERVNMGMKLSCGFEMLIADPHNRDKRAVREIEVLLEDVERGEELLPIDEEIKAWPQQEDDESWLDVNYEDFERELSGKGKEGKINATGGSPGAFGDKAAQENLRRMVERFEQFLNDEDAGPDGADFDDMDFDDEDEDEDDAEGDEGEDFGEDREASFDEEDFAKMMKEMMGMPSAEPTLNKRTPAAGRVEELDSDEESDGEGEEDLKKVMQRMEDELREAGALDLNGSRAGEEHTDDPNYQLAKNLLESFKGQAGTAGPTGNLMASLGVKLPRDERT